MSETIGADTGVKKIQLGTLAPRESVQGHPISGSLTERIVRARTTPLHMFLSGIVAGANVVIDRSPTVVETKVHKENDETVPGDIHGFLTGALDPYVAANNGEQNV